MGELQRTRQQQTLNVIADAAMSLFTERGFGNTSMEDVAVAAGVSRRTLYRYFDTKDDLVFEHPRRWFEIVRGVAASRTANEATRDLGRRCTLAVAEFIAADPKPVLEAFAVLQATPDLVVRHGKSDALWNGFYSALILEDLGTATNALLTASVAASALTGATNALIAVWAADPRQDLVVMTRAVLDQVDDLWPPASR